LFGRTYGYGSDGSQSPPNDSPNLRSRSSSAVGKNGGGLFGFTPMNGTTTPRDPPPEFHATVDLIKEEHFKAARANIQDPEILAELEDEIDRDCEWLRSFLYAAKVRPFPGIPAFDPHHTFRSSTKYHFVRKITSSVWERSWRVSLWRLF
jgi:aspartate kinase